MNTNYFILVWKVGDPVNKKIIAKTTIENSKGIAKTAELIAAGLSKSDISNLCNNGYIERVRHGYYSLAEANNAGEEQLIQTLLPEAIVCVESALFHYGYSDFAPRVWTLAVPRTMTKTKINTFGQYHPHLLA